MKRLKITRTHVLSGVGIVLAIAFLALCFVLYQLEEARIGNLRSALDSARAETADTRSADQVAYQSLLDKYTQVYGQLVDAGQLPTTEAPDVIEGLPGATGATGPKGDAPSFSDLLQAVQSFCSPGTANPPCKGETGAQGAQGVPGATVVGPAGQNGADGAPGAPGAAGADGQPPVSWTYTDLLGMHTCSRTDPFDAAAPTYQCT